MCNGLGSGGRGTAVGVLADSLLKTSTLVKWREGLIAGNLVLISPFYPEVRFTVGNAMARNKYIYCLAESAMVVRAGNDRWNDNRGDGGIKTSVAAHAG